MRTIIKLTLCVLVLLGSLFRSGAQKPTPANEMLKSAFEKAEQERKNVFVMFTASWCVNCHILKDSVLESKFSKSLFEENYVVVYLTALESTEKKFLENPGATQLYQKYTAKAGKSVGIPFYIVLNPKGKILGDAFMLNEKKELTNIGRPHTFYEIYAFLELLSKTSSLDYGVLNNLGKYLSKQ